MLLEYPVESTQYGEDSTCQPDKHDDSSASQLVHESQIEDPGDENCPLVHGMHMEVPAVGAYDPTRGCNKTTWIIMGIRYQ